MHGLWIVSLAFHKTAFSSLLATITVVSGVPRIGITQWYQSPMYSGTLCLNFNHGPLVSVSGCDGVTWYGPHPLLLRPLTVLTHTEFCRMNLLLKKMIFSTENSARLKHWVPIVWMSTRHDAKLWSFNSFRPTYSWKWIMCFGTGL